MVTIQRQYTLLEPRKILIIKTTMPYECVFGSLYYTFSFIKYNDGDERQPQTYN